MASTLLLSVQDATISFGKKPLFEGLSFNIHAGNKICLVGKNGAGKSTLMQIITGQRTLDAGTRWQLQGVKIGYLQQEVAVKPGQTVRDFVFAGLEKENQHDYMAYKVDTVIEPLALNPEAALESLSGGQLRRAALARALVEAPDILLLDEPTNHLDLEVIAWLEGFLKTYRGALVCVSHDRAFLSAISDTIFWLDRGKIRFCPKGFAHFEAWSTQLIEQELRELHNRQKQVDLETEWANRGVKARRKRNVRRRDQVVEASKKLKSDKNALLKMLAKIEWSPADVAESSAVVAEFHKVSKGFGGEVGAPTCIMEKFSLRIMQGDRIGIIGKNGSGKSTFLKLLLGEIKPDSGTVKLAKNHTFSYFDQNRKGLNPDHSLHRTLCPNGSDYVDVMGKNRHVCGYLRDFLFDPLMAADSVSTLSGGQKNRLMLAKIMANPGSVLILDEPTNDLDMDTLDMLEEMLANYSGTLFIVSHDRDFLEQTVSKMLAFEGNGVIEASIGGYQDYLAEKERRAGKGRANPAAKEKPPAVAAPAAAAAVKKPTPKRSYIHQYELDRLPAKIAALEQEIQHIESKLADADLFARDATTFHTLLARLEAARVEKNAAEDRWLELEAG